MDDATRAFAFVARRQGHASMPSGQWALVLSMDLGWMTPPQARQFVARAQAAGLLEPDGDALRLRVDPAVVEVPLGFRPDPDAAPTGAAADPFVEWLARVAKARPLPRDQVLAEVSARQDRLHGLLDAETALLWLAAESGLDVREAAKTHLRVLQAAPPTPAQ